MLKLHISKVALYAFVFIYLMHLRVDYSSSPAFEMQVL